jgi:7-carboxy-7-deazaguanine synthase
MGDSLVVNEIYLSLQGESTWAGLPCIFIRLTGCGLRCSYCDTAYAFTTGKRRPVVEILTEIRHLAKGYAGATSLAGVNARIPLVEFTGGEPLLQPGAPAVMKTLCDEGFTVLVETGGAHDLSVLDPRVRAIMDLKVPSSGELARNDWSNLARLKSSDELKLVLGTWEDYAWTKATLLEHRLTERCPVLVSWVAPLASHQQDKSLKAVPPGHRPMSRQELVEAIIQDRLPVRFQLQMHKFVWPPDQRGV